MKLLSIGILFAIFLAPPIYSAERPEEGTPQKVFDFAFLVFEEFRITPEIGVVYQPTLDEELGEPIRTEQKIEGTRDPTYTMSLETLYYDGLEIDIYRPMDARPAAWTWLKRVYISNPKYALKHGIRVGMKRKEFAATLGLSALYGNAQGSIEEFGVSGYGEPGGVTHRANAIVTLSVDQADTIEAITIKYIRD